MTRFVRHYLLALQFFTRVPVTGRLADWVGYSPAMLRASAAHFPGVGWLAGAWMAAVFFGLQWWLPVVDAAPWVAAVGATVAGVLLTGAFHEDGLADLADGLGGSADRLRALEIMKDSRIGSFGALALALALLSKVSLLAVLAAHSPSAVLAALLAGHVVSRFWPLLLAHTLPCLGDAGTNRDRPLAQPISRRGLGIAGAWCVAALAMMWLAEGPGFPILATAAGGLALLWLRGRFAGRLQGFTPEGLGATQQVCEAAFYLGAAVGLRVG